jgi:hypothetical protein
MEPSNTEWHWYKVTFDLGMQGTEEFPTDPIAFLKWLMGEQEKYIGGLDVRSAKLALKPA